MRASLGSIGFEKIRERLSISLSPLLCLPLSLSLSRKRHTLEASAAETQSGQQQQKTRHAAFARTVRAGGTREQTCRERGCFACVLPPLSVCSCMSVSVQLVGLLLVVPHSFRRVFSLTAALCSACVIVTSRASPCCYSHMVAVRSECRCRRKPGATLQCPPILCTRQAPQGKETDDRGRQDSPALATRSVALLLSVMCSDLSLLSLARCTSFPARSSLSHAASLPASRALLSTRCALFCQRVLQRTGQHQALCPNHRTVNSPSLPFSPSAGHDSCRLFLCSTCRVCPLPNCTKVCVRFHSTRAIVQLSRLHQWSLLLPLLTLPSSRRLRTSATCGQPACPSSLVHVSHSSRRSLQQHVSFVWTSSALYFPILFAPPSPVRLVPHVFVRRRPTSWKVG